MRQLALLRGVNVGGQRRVPMAALRELCAGLGWDDAQTYIQSGNVLLDAAAPAETVSALLRGAIARRFGFDVPVVVLTRSELGQIVLGNPLVDAMVPPEALHVTIFHDPPPPRALADLRLDGFAPERGVVGPRCVYLHLPNGVHGAKLSQAFLERHCGVPATTRNWRTVLQLERLLANGA